MHKSYFYGSPDDYIQVVAHKEQYHDKLVKMGFVESVDQLGKQDKSEMVDVRELINEASNKDELEDAVKSLLDVDLDKRRSLENMKIDALKVLDER